MRALALLVGLGLAGCMGLSQNMRAHVLPAGESRIGLAGGSTRDLETDFFHSAPTTEQPPQKPFAVLWEFTFHHGISDRLDLGVRIRPMGAKVEALFQILDPDAGPVGLSVGLGAGGFLHDRVEQEYVECDGQCDLVGNFSYEYQGVDLDVPVVLSRRVARTLVLFAGARYSHLFLWGEQRFESQDDSFQPLVVEKRVSQPIFGAVAGLQFEWGLVNLIPQLIGTTLAFPGRHLRFALFFAFDLGFVF